MDQYFLLIYHGNDAVPKLRILSETGIENEVSTADVALFQKTPLQTNYSQTSFAVFIPVGETERRALDFDKVIFTTLLHVSSGQPAWKLFEEMTEDLAIDLYKRQVASLIHDALFEKTHFTIH